MFRIGVLIPEGYTQSTWPLTHEDQMARSLWQSSAVKNVYISHTSQGIIRNVAIACNAYH